MSNATVCPYITIVEYRKLWEEEMRSLKQNPTAKAWKALCEDIRDGYVWNLTMLNEGESGPLKIATSTCWLSSQLYNPPFLFPRVTP